MPPGWFERAASRVADVATRVSDKTSAVLDFNSGAADVIVVRHTLMSGETELRCSSWAVHVGRDNKTTLSAETVDVLLNGRPTSLRMFVGDDHNCCFGGGALQPEPEELAALELRDGENSLTFRLSSAPNTSFAAQLWVWPADAALVVCDIDGTITRSDLLGYGAHKLGFDAAHSGVCEAFHAIQQQGYRPVYVSARPITKAGKTRELLALVGHKESGLEMPAGPLITTSERTLSALVRSLRRKGGGADEFKVGVLLDIAAAFVLEGGRPSPRVFYAGFGNRDTDAQAYNAAGVPKNRIFIIDERSRLSVRETRQLFESYSELVGLVPQFFPPIATVRAREEAEIKAAQSANGHEQGSEMTETEKGVEPGLESMTAMQQGLPSFAGRRQSGQDCVGVKLTDNVANSLPPRTVDAGVCASTKDGGSTGEQMVGEAKEESGVKHAPSRFLDEQGGHRGQLWAGVGGVDGGYVDPHVSRGGSSSSPGAVGDTAGGAAPVADAASVGVEVASGNDRAQSPTGKGAAGGKGAPTLSQGTAGAGTRGEATSVGGKGKGKEEVEDEDDFDPDVWRRQQKRLVRAQRVAEANSRWGFTADGLAPSVAAVDAAWMQAGAGAPGRPGGTQEGVAGGERGGMSIPREEGADDGGSSRGAAAASQQETMPEGTEDQGRAEEQKRGAAVAEAKARELPRAARASPAAADIKKHSLFAILTAPHGEGGVKAERDGCGQGAGSDDDDDDDEGTCSSSSSIVVEAVAPVLGQDPTPLPCAAQAGVVRAAEPVREGRGDGGGGGQRELEGEMVGLGLTFKKGAGKGDKGLVIKRMKPDSPAARCDELRVGQCVESIDGTPLDGIRSARQLAELTQGKAGSAARLRVREDDGQVRSLVLIR